MASSRACKVGIPKPRTWEQDNIGYESGDGGGLLIAEGVPKTVATLERSHTGRYLGRIFEK